MLVWTLLVCALLLLPAEADENRCHVHRIDIDIGYEDADRPNCLRDNGHFMTEEETGVHKMQMKEEGMCDVKVSCVDSVPTFCWGGHCAFTRNECEHVKIKVFKGIVSATCQPSEHAEDNEHFHHD